MGLLDMVRELYRDVATRLAPFLRTQRGVSTVEYALITIAVISIVGAAVALLGDSFTGLFGDISNELTTARSAAGSAGVT